MKFLIDHWYLTSDNFVVQFITDIKKDGMYNVFRHTSNLDWGSYYTDENGETAYGEKIIKKWLELVPKYGMVYDRDPKIDIKQCHICGLNFDSCNCDIGDII